MKPPPASSDACGTPRSLGRPAVTRSWGIGHNRHMPRHNDCGRNAGGGLGGDGWSGGREGGERSVAGGGEGPEPHLNVSRIGREDQARIDLEEEGGQGRRCRYSCERRPCGGAESLRKAVGGRTRPPGKNRPPIESNPQRYRGHHPPGNAATAPCVVIHGSNGTSHVTGPCI